MGDIQLGRGVRRGYMGADLYAMFDGVRHLLRSADIAFGNLESIVVHGGQRKSGGIAFRAHPLTLMALEHAGFDALSLANNHAYDYGRPALLRSAARLRRRGIIPVGVGSAEGLRPQPVWLQARGVRVAFLAYSLFPGADGRIDTSAVRLGQLAQDVAKAQERADVVCVSVHWGIEYQTAPTPTQSRIGRAAIDAGADMVIGHHPHVFQGVEVYRGKVIAYSLGNFLFDQPWDHTRDSLLLDWRGGVDGRPEVRIYPIRIDKEPYRTRVLIGAEGRALLERCAALSAVLGTRGVFETDSWRLELPRPKAAPAADLSPVPVTIARL